MCNTWDGTISGLFFNLTGVYLDLGFLRMLWIILSGTGFHPPQLPGHLYSLLNQLIDLHRAHT